VRLKKPFGWMRRIRVDEFARLLQTNRPAAIGIIVIGVLATAMLFGAHQSSARKDAKPAERAAVAAPAPESAAQPAAAKTMAVTITGCLQRDDETFRLKDTDGADAPKARSWKTGFLKKSSASIEIVDAANRLKLNNHVGERVTVTGTLVDREMRARTLQRIASSCANSKPAKSEAL
jgi:hypothetical protein